MAMCAHLTPEDPEDGPKSESIKSVFPHIDPIQLLETHTHTYYTHA